MTAQSWRSITHKNINILTAFLLLNFISPRCRWSPPIYGSAFYAALRLIVACSGLLLWHWKFPQRK
jgi:hypothetical protein